MSSIRDEKRERRRKKKKKEEEKNKKSTKVDSSNKTFLFGNQPIKRVIRRQNEKKGLLDLMSVDRR